MDEVIKLISTFDDLFMRDFISLHKTDFNMFHTTHLFLYLYSENHSYALISDFWLFGYNWTKPIFTFET